MHGYTLQPLILHFQSVGDSVCRVSALCIDHIEHEKDFHARAYPLRGDMYEGNERSMRVQKRLAEDAVGQDEATTETE